MIEGNIRNCSALRHSVRSSELRSAERSSEKSLIIKPHQIVGSLAVKTNITRAVDRELQTLSHTVGISMNESIYRVFPDISF